MTYPEGPHGDRGRGPMTWPQAWAGPETPRAGGSRKDPASRALPTPSFWVASLQNHKRMNEGYLWYHYGLGTLMQEKSRAMQSETSQQAALGPRLPGPVSKETLQRIRAGLAWRVQCPGLKGSWQCTAGSHAQATQHLCLHPDSSALDTWEALELSANPLRTSQPTSPGSGQGPPSPPSTHLHCWSSSHGCGGWP